MCGHYFCTRPKFSIFLYFILTTICTYAFHFNIIYNSMYILNKNKIKCVYPSIISYYKFNVYIDNNTCIYFCLKMLTSILHYVCIFFNLIIHVWTLLLHETKVLNIPIFYFNNNMYICISFQYNI